MRAELRYCPHGPNRCAWWKRKSYFKYVKGMKPMSGTKVRPNSNPVLDLMRDDDMGDPWGTAMGWAFAVAGVLHAAGEEVPASMEYQPSPYVYINPDEVPEEYPDSMVWHLLHRTPGCWVDPDYGATVAELQFAGRCLSRYLGWLRAAGMSY